HDGFIDVESSFEKGTLFKLYFPVVETDALSDSLAEYGDDRESTPAEKTTSGLMGTETILVADDEADIRDTLKGIIEEYGYRTVLFRDGLEALEAFQAQPRRFDLIITDMTMPGKTGMELIQEVRSTDPKIPIILCSGFSEVVNDESALKMGANKYLMKPIPEGALIRALRQLLDETGIRKGA
ncbi:MAG: response regulator, partial [Desulfobacteraceae bacterium]